MPPKIISVALPTSGHDELLDALIRYFNLTSVEPTTKNWIGKGRAISGPLNYCEYYNHCQTEGCTDAEVNFQKNNDFGSRLEIKQEFTYLVQYRHPLEFLVEYYKKGSKDELNHWKKFANRQIHEWKNFVNKWIINNTHKEAHTISFRDLHFKPSQSLTKTIQLIKPSIIVDDDNAKKAVHKLGNPDCDIEKFKHFEADFFNYLQEIVREEMLFLKLEVKNYKTKSKSVINLGASSVKHYVYYHSEKLLAKTQPVFKAPQNIDFVDLNNLELPENLVVDGLSIIDNKAIFSEYFGHLLLKPETDMVGLFTYSIPLKFCKEHVDFLEKNKNLFQPYISFDLLKGKEFDPDKLYGAEFSSYDWDYDGREIIEEIDNHKDFHISPVNNGTSGPFKGTIVVSREKFLQFQKWFWKVTLYLLDKYGYKSGVSLKKENIGKYWAEKDLDYDVNFRRGIGQIQERLLAYYFGRTFHDKDKVDLRYFLNEDRFFKLVTYYQNDLDSSLSVLKENINNPYIKEVYVLHKGTPRELAELTSNKKVFCIPTSKDPKIADLLHFANENFLIENCIVADPHTVIGDSIHKGNDYMAKQSVLMVSPHVKHQDGKEQLITERRSSIFSYRKKGAFFDRNSCAAICFKTPVNQSVIDNLQKNMPLVESFKGENYSIFNPCHEIKIYQHQKHLEKGFISIINHLTGTKGFLNPDHTRQLQDKHWVEGEQNSSKINLYTYFTPTHQILYDKWFKPSIKDDYNIVVKLCEQEAKNGVFEKKGWMNTMRQKNDLLVAAVKENSDDVFIFSDVDIQFFKRTKAILLDELGDKDIMFQRDASADFGGPKMLGVACSGFFISRGNKRTLSFFKAVRKMIENDESIKGDQVAFNRVLEKNTMKLKWGYLSSKFYSPGSSEAIPGNNWVWSPNIPFKVPKDTVMHHANWTRGIENKILQLEYVKEQMTEGFYQSWIDKNDEQEEDLIDKLKNKLQYTHQIERIAIKRAQKLNQINQSLKSLSSEKELLAMELAEYKNALAQKEDLVKKQYSSITWKIGSLFVKPIDFLLKKNSDN